MKREFPYRRGYLRPKGSFRHHKDPAQLQPAEPRAAGAAVEFLQPSHARKILLIKRLRETQTLVIGSGKGVLDLAVKSNDMLLYCVIKLILFCQSIKCILHSHCLIDVIDIG